MLLVQPLEIFADFTQILASSHGYDSLDLDTSSLRNWLTESLGGLAGLLWNTPDAYIQ